MKTVNPALIGKGLLQLGEDPEGLWKTIIFVKNTRWISDGWRINRNSRNSSEFRKMVELIADANIRYGAGQR